MEANKAKKQNAVDSIQNQYNEESLYAGLQTILSRWKEINNGQTSDELNYINALILDLAKLSVT